MVEFFTYAKPLTQFFVIDAISYQFIRFFFVAEKNMKYYCKRKKTETFDLLIVDIIGGSSSHS